jgi:hypothetical protein
MKGLSEKEQKEIGEIVEEVIQDPLLQPCRASFKNALKFTISGDYKSDIDTAEQEFIIAAWRAAVAIKHGWGKHDPSPDTLKDREQRKKFFQTWIFNYLKQILNENKRFFKPFTKLGTVSAYSSYVEKIANITSAKAYKSCNYNFVFKVDTYMLPKSKIQLLNEYKQNLESKEVTINILPDSITIESIFEKMKCDIIQELEGISYNLSQDDLSMVISTNEEESISKITKIIHKYDNRFAFSVSNGKVTINNNPKAVETIQVKTNERISTASISANKEEDEIGMPELEDMNPVQFKDPDSIKEFYSNLSAQAKSIMQIIIEAPDDYIDKYGTDKPVQKYMADYLGVSIKDIKKAMAEMRLKYIDLIGSPDKR